MCVRVGWSVISP